MRSEFARLCVLASSVYVAGAYAAHPLVTEDTGTQGKGGWQLEVNAEVSRDSTDGVGTRGFRPAATLSYGVADAVDVQVGRPYQRLITDDGSTWQESNGGLDTALDLKWRFFENARFSLGLKPGVTFATGRYEAGRVQVGRRLGLCWSLHGTRPRTRYMDTWAFFVTAML